MKIVLLGDTHNGASRSSPVIQSYFSKFYAFFFKYLEDNDIKTIIQTGDFFDQRRDIHFTTIQGTNEYFFSPLKKLGIDLYIISGNHDCTYKNHNRTNSIDLLCRDKATIVDLIPKTISIDGINIDLFPWISPENLTDSLDFAKKSTSEYAVGHFEFNNFPMLPGVMSTHGMDHSLFANYEQVFSGHFHTISQKDNVLFVGTPYELNFGDCDDIKGFWVLDTDTGLKEHIRNPFTLFEKINYVEDMVYDFTQVNEKYVKITVVDKKDQKKFDNFVSNIQHNKPYDLKISESSIKESITDAVDVTTFATTQVMIDDVVTNLDTNLDKDKLKSAIMVLYSEAIQQNSTL